MANNINNQKLSNLIKADLQDALTNDSRWKREGLQYYFQDYWKWGTKEIWIDTDNEELKRELAENRLRNWTHRQEKRKQKEKEYKAKYGKSYSISEADKIEHENRKVLVEELESQDWQEIIGLIDQINPLGEKKNQAKKAEVDAKLASQPGLTYWQGGGKRFYGTDDWGRGWCSFRVIENGQGYTVSVPKEHLALTNFPFATEGFHIIGGVDHLPITQWSHWREKKVGLNDNITFTPYQIENDSELPENLEREVRKEEWKNCDTCQKTIIDNGAEKWYSIKRYHGQKSKTIHACSNCYKNKESEYLQNYEFIFQLPANDGNVLETIKGGKTDCYAGQKDQNGKILQQQNCSHCQPWKQHKVSNPNDNKSKLNIEFLAEYFLRNHIKKIQLINGNLVITHNNNETISSEQLTNNSEYQIIKNNLQKNNKNELTSSELGLDTNTSPTTNSPNSPSENKYLWLVGGITLGAILFGILLFFFQRQRKKSKRVKIN